MAAQTKQPTVIKKYANRRLYDTGSSAYVTLEDLAVMVKRGEDFEVFDARTGEDITRSVLTQIIFEQEGKDGQGLLPVNVLRQLIRFYGDSMQMLVPSYLEFTVSRLAGEQQKFREQVASALSASPMGEALSEPTRAMFHQLDEQARVNMTMFRQALNIFNPFAPAASLPAASLLAASLNECDPRPDEAGAPSLADASASAQAGQQRRGQQLDDLRRQLRHLQKRLDDLTS